MTSEIGTVLRASDITGEGFTFVTDSQDLESLAHYFPGITDDMTAAFVIVANGDYSEVWVTESSRPYDVNAIYERVI